MSDLTDVFANNAPDPSTQNAPYVASPQAEPTNVRLPGATYNTQLDPLDELAFRGWLKQNNVPFNPDAASSDYDMRGFYKAQQQGNPQAASAVDPNDSRLHYTDAFKTPQHQTFSNLSQWATPIAPQWTPDDKLVSPGGRILFDDRAQR